MKKEGRLPEEGAGKTRAWKGRVRATRLGVVGHGPALYSVPRHIVFFCIHPPIRPRTHFILTCLSRTCQSPFPMSWSSCPTAGWLNER